MVERWYLPFDYGGSAMTRNPVGDYVRYSDYAALTKQVEELTRERDMATAITNAYSDEQQKQLADLKAAERQRDEANAETAGLRKASIRVLASLVATISIIERAQEKKKHPSAVVASNKMFRQMLADYRASITSAREVLSTTPSIALADLTARIERETLNQAAVAGWNACRKSLYAVCEDVEAEADRIRTVSTVGTASEEQHAKGYHAGTCRAAKSIARGFNSMDAEDDDNLATAIEALMEGK